MVMLVSLFHLTLCKRYVLRIYFNRKTNEFTVTTWRWYLPFTTTSIRCKPGAALYTRWAEDQYVSPMLGNTKINGKSFFINENHFVFPVYHNVLYGFSELSALNDMMKESIEDHNAIAERKIKFKDKSLSSSDW